MTAAACTDVLYAVPHHPLTRCGPTSTTPVAWVVRRRSAVLFLQPAGRRLLSAPVDVCALPTALLRGVLALPSRAVSRVGDAQVGRLPARGGVLTGHPAGAIHSQGEARTVEGSLAARSASRKACRRCPTTEGVPAEEADPASCSFISDTCASPVSVLGVPGAAQGGEFLLALGQEVEGALEERSRRASGACASKTV